MATFYIQLENRLLQISGELTAENISKALGYVPVSPNVTNELSQRVDNITFDSLKDNPFLQDGSGELNIVDDTGNIIAKIDAEGLHSVDFIAGTNILSQKADKSELPTKVSELENDSKFITIDEVPEVNVPTKVSELENDKGYITASDVPEIEIPSLDGFVKSEDLPNFDEFAKTEDIPSLDDYASKEWVNNKNYATEYDLKTIDYSSINNVPVSEDETGELNIIDESGNIGMKVASDAVYAKDFVSSSGALNDALSRISQLEETITDLLNRIQTLEEVNS